MRIRDHCQTTCLILAMACLIYAVPLQATEEAPGGVPDARISNAIHNFGVVMEGDPVSHAFTVTNQGTVPLKILKMDTG